MAKEAELRSRDLYQMLAEPTITEEPALIGVGIDFPRGIPLSDTLPMSDEFDSLKNPNTVFKVVPLNLLSAPNFVDESRELDVSEYELSQEPNFASVWGAKAAGKAPSQEQISLRHRTINSAKLEATSGTVTISQEINVSGGETISSELWGLVTAVSGGGTASLRVVQLDSSNNPIGGPLNADANWNAVSADWVRRSLNSQALNAGARKLRFEASISGSITVYFVGARIVEGTLLGWQERAIVGFSSVGSI